MVGYSVYRGGVENSGIFRDIGNLCTRQYIGAWQQFFHTFQVKGSRGENT